MSFPSTPSKLFEMPLGNVEPRLFPQPLRDLTQPDATYGHEVIWFARDVLGQPLDPWQEWLVIHAGELLSNGRPRFRKILAIVARQNGKTHLLKVLVCYWMFVEGWKSILGMSTHVSLAKEAWEGAQEMARESELLAEEFGRVHGDNNDPKWVAASGSTYRIAAATGRAGGRGRSLDRLIMDELREHKNWDAYKAAVPAMNAKPMAQGWFISNLGDDTAVVLHSLRDGAIDAMEKNQTGNVGLFEYSAPDGSKATDPVALAMANPNVGRRIDWDTLLADAVSAEQAGGEQLTGHLTEVMNMRIRVMDPAVDPTAWTLSADTSLSLAPFRSSLVAFVDVAPGLHTHATLALAAAMPNGKVGLQIAKTWDGPTAVTEMEHDLPGLIAQIRPRKVGWMPVGPAAVVAASLAVKKGVWPPPGVVVEEVRAEVPAVCMGFAALVKGDGVRHLNEPILNDHALGAQKLKSGDTWRFSRKGKGDCDAVYAAAGAAHLARTMPTGSGRVRVLLPSAGR